MPISQFLSDFYFYLPKNALDRLILSGVVRRIAFTLLSLFSPVYIFVSLSHLGYSQVFAMIFVLFYYFFTFLVKVLTQIISEDLSRRIGFKNTIRSSILPFLLFILFLTLASNQPALFLLAAFFLGIQAGLFWWGYHGYFIKKGEKEHFGQSVGRANLLETAASVLTPVLGAYLIKYLGFSSLFILSAVFMLISLLLLGKGSKTRQIHDVKFINVINLIKNHKSVSLAYVSVGAEAIISSVVWPIFLFLFFKRVVSLGIIVSLSALTASIFAIAIGQWVDKQGERKIVGFGAPLLFFSWIIRLLDFSFFVFVIGDSLRNFGQRMVAMPLNALSYKKALEAESAKAILFLETTQSIGILVSLLILVLLILAGGNLSWGFVLASLFSLLPLVAVVRGKLRSLNE